MHARIARRIGVGLAVASMGMMVVAPAQSSPLPRVSQVGLDLPQTPVDGIVDDARGTLAPLLEGDRTPSAPTPTAPAAPGPAAPGKNRSADDRSGVLGPAVRRSGPASPRRARGGRPAPTRSRRVPSRRLLSGVALAAAPRGGRTRRRSAGGRREPLVEGTTSRRVALPKPLREIVGSLPRSVKGVLALMSVILALLLALVLRSRRQLADALARAYGDALTGLPNRAAVDETLRRMAGHASRNGSQMAAVLFDIDHFKAINDGHGHAKGDEVLTAVGAAARASVRSADFVGRYGGEEFLLLMPDTGQRGALKVAEKVQRALRDIDVVGIDSTVTASFGVAAGRGDQDELRNLVEVADEALYRAKEAGRDRIEIAHPARSVLTAA